MKVLINIRFYADADEVGISIDNMINLVSRISAVVSETLGEREIETDYAVLNEDEFTTEEILHEQENQNDI